MYWAIDDEVMLARAAQNTTKHVRAARANFVLPNGRRRPRPPGHGIVLGAGRFERIGGGGSGLSLTGFACNIFIASCTARSSCGSCPAMTSFGMFSTSISGFVP